MNTVIRVLGERIEMIYDLQEKGVINGLEGKRMAEKEIIDFSYSEPVATMVHLRGLVHVFEQANELRMRTQEFDFFKLRMLNRDF